MAPSRWLFCGVDLSLVASLARLEYKFVLVKEREYGRTQTRCEHGVASGRRKSRPLGWTILDVGGNRACLIGLPDYRHLCYGCRLRATIPRCDGERRWSRASDSTTLPGGDSGH